MQKNAKHTETVKTKSSTYFLDLREASNGNHFISVANSRKNKEGAYETVRISIWQEDIPEFAAAMARMVEQFTAQTQPEPANA